MPTLLATWAVWIPLMAIIYSLPLALQFPLFSLALTFWVLLLTYMTNSFARKTLAAPGPRCSVVARHRPSDHQMKSHEIFQHMSPALAAEILSYLQNEQKPVFKAVVQGLASQRKLRAVFVERKPPNERYAWIKNALSRKAADTLAAHLLQAWLLGAQKPMLCDFLDSLGITHDEDGTVENLPDSPPKEKLAESSTSLLAKYPAEAVAVYLHAFHDMDSTVSWPPLGEVLAETSDSNWVRPPVIECFWQPTD